LADRHLCVRKRRSSGRVQTQVENLDQEQREVELARMLGGGASAGTARRHARALLLAARGSKEVEVRSRPRRSSSRGRGGKGGQAWA
ncbi:MAG: DNA repair protein RecN, partial [Acidobacteriota bacterium]